MDSNEDGDFEFSPFESHHDGPNEDERDNLFHFNIENIPIIIFPELHAMLTILFLLLKTK